MRPVYFDIHSHLNVESFEDDRDTVIAGMQDERVWTITVGVDKESSQKACDISLKWDGLFATIGAHPTDDTSESFDVAYYQSLLDQYKKIVAIGECGLDLYRTPHEQKEAELKRQIHVFEAQIDLAVRFDKPLMIHCRDAHAELIDILKLKKKEHGDALRGNIHFFTADTQIAQSYFDLNFTISFTGVLTFTHDYDDIIAYAPLDMIMSETDAPYVAPIPFRDKRCEPGYVSYVVERIAQIKGVPHDQVRVAMVNNAFRVFGISPEW